MLKPRNIEEIISLSYEYMGLRQGPDNRPVPSAVAYATELHDLAVVLGFQRPMELDLLLKHIRLQDISEFSRM